MRYLVLDGDGFLLSIYKTRKEAEDMKRTLEYDTGEFHNICEQ